MHVIALFIAAAIAWGIAAKGRSNTIGSAVGLGVLGGILAVIVAFCFYRFIPSGFRRDMLWGGMPDGLYIILFEILPAFVLSLIAGILVIPSVRTEQEHRESRRLHEEELTDAQKRFVEDLRARFSKRSTEKLQKMRRKGRDSWSEEALIAVDRILKERGIE
jgi:uncharacterized membrane protein